MGKRARYTLFKGEQGHSQGCDSHRAVAEYHEITFPRMRVRHFNIAGVAWSNFKPGINTNGRTAISNMILSIDVVNLTAGVDKAIVALREVGVKLKREGGGGREVEAAGCVHHVFAGRSVTSKDGNGGSGSGSLLTSALHTVQRAK